MTKRRKCFPEHFSLSTLVVVVSFLLFFVFFYIFFVTSLKKFSLALICCCLPLFDICYFLDVYRFMEVLESVAKIDQSALCSKLINNTFLINNLI